MGIAALNRGPLFILIEQIFPPPYCWRRRRSFRSKCKSFYLWCSRNRRRSLTAEKLFEGSPLYQVRSAGTQPEARIVVTEGHIGWADIIFCMEKSHVNLLRRKFPEAMGRKRLICLNIPDEYELMDPSLIDEFHGCLSPYLTLPD